MSRTIAVYGSLKMGHYNHDMLGDSKCVGETKLKGTLYRVSSYPALLEEGDNEYDAEIYEVSDEVFQRLSSMERGAGYVEKEVDGNVVWYAGIQLADYCRESKEVIESY